MSFLMNEIFGVKILIWLPFLLSIIIFLYALWFMLGNRIKGWFYTTFSREKAIKVVFHHPTKCFTFKWETIPDAKTFTSDGKEYIFDEKAIISSKFGFGNEIHYFHNKPNPIDFKTEGSKVSASLSANNLKAFKENDLFVKLLSLQGEKNLLLMVIILNVIILVVVVVTMLYQMGFLEGLLK